MTSTTVEYEWAVETMDGPEDDADIIDVYHESTYAAAQAMANGKQNARVALVRNAYRNGNRSRSWAYIEDGKLPVEFLDAYYRPIARVPVRFRREVGE